MNRISTNEGLYPAQWFQILIQGALGYFTGCGKEEDRGREGGELSPQFPLQLQPQQLCVCVCVRARACVCVSSCVCVCFHTGVLLLETKASKKPYVIPYKKTSSFILHMRKTVVCKGEVLNSRNYG